MLSFLSVMRRVIVALGLSLACISLPAPLPVEHATAAEPSLLIEVTPSEHIESRGSSIPAGAQRVAMLRLRLSAACAADVPVTTLTLWHRGRGDRRDILSVYAMSGGRRVSRGRQFASGQGDVTLRLRSFVVPACATRELTVLADFSAEAAATGEHQLILLSEADVEASALVSLSTLRQPPFRRTVPRTVGQISVEYLTLTEPLRYGENRRVARFQLIADGADDHRIEAITLTNQGSAHDADLRNLFLESTRGERLTAVASSMEGDSVRLVFETPLILRKNDTQAFTLRADIRASRRRTIQFVIEEPGDIEAGVVRGRRR